MKKDYASTLEYLAHNKVFLENREKGKMRGAQWYSFVYPKNIDLMKQVKILTPDIVDRAQFAFDEDGEYAFTSGYGITLKKETGISPKYILGLLNSKLLEFYLKRVSTPMRGGFFRVFTQFLAVLPIRPINFSDPADKALHGTMVGLVESMLALHKHKAAAQTQPEQELLQRQIEITDRQIDAAGVRALRTDSGRDCNCGGRRVNLIPRNCPFGIPAKRVYSLRNFRLVF